jgi:hypothetical protein
MPAQRVGAASSGIAGDHDVERGRQDRLDLDAIKQAGASGRKGGSEGVALSGGECLDPPALLDVAQQQKVPGLAQADAGGLMGRDEDPLEHGIIDGVHGEPCPDVAARGDGVIDSRTTIGLKGGCAHARSPFSWSVATRSWVMRANS